MVQINEFFTEPDWLVVA